MAESREKIQVFVDKDNIIHVIEQLKMTDESAQAEVEAMIKLSREHNSHKLLVDIASIQVPTAKQRKIISDGLKQIKFEKAALISNSVVIKTVANFIVSAAGHKQFEFFNSEKEALAWLKEGDNNA